MLLQWGCSGGVIEGFSKVVVWELLRVLVGKLLGMLVNSWRETGGVLK